MGRVWPITLATASATFLLAVGGCGDSERLDPGAANAGAGGHTLMGDGGGHRGGSAGDAGSGELAGDGAGASGELNEDNAGAPSGNGGSGPHGGGGTHAGGSGAVGGHSAGGTGASPTSGGSAGTSAEAGDTGLAGAGTGGTGGITQLTVCNRLMQPTTPAWDVSRAFERSVNLDCRIDWVRLLYLDPDQGLDVRIPFLNQLIAFSLDLWGCIGASKPTTFDLIWKATPLSAADVALLIDDYVAAATTPLELSPDEIADLRALLGRLAEPLLMDPDPGGLSNPRCDTTGSAGASGAGGQAGSG